MQKLLLKDEIRNIIDTVQKSNWDTDYAIRYVVVSISRLVKRDPSFFLASEEDRLKMFQNGTYNEYPYVICKTLHELIGDVLACLGIGSSVVVATNTKIPLYALIVEGEHSRYFVDALNDLFRSQYRIQPVSYGSLLRSNNCILDSVDLRLINLPLDYIKQMDLDMGLIPGQYLNESAEELMTKLIVISQAKVLFGTDNFHELLKRKIEFLSRYFLNVYPVDGPIERKVLHIYLRTHAFNKLERNSFVVSNRTDKEGYPICVKIEFEGLQLEYEEVLEDRKYSLQLVSESFSPSK